MTTDILGRQQTHATNTSAHCDVRYLLTYTSTHTSQDWTQTTVALQHLQVNLQQWDNTSQRQTDRQTTVVIPLLLVNCVDTRSSDTGLVIKSCCSSRRHCRLVSSLRPTSTNNTLNTSFCSSTFISCPRYQWPSVSLRTAHGWPTSQPSHSASVSPVTHTPHSMSSSTPQHTVWLIDWLSKA